MASMVLFKDFGPLVEPGFVVQLPLQGRYPYPIEKSRWFWMTYAQQIMMGFSLISVHVCTDTLFVGLFLKASCQIDILKYRLRKITNSFDEESNLKYKSFTHMQKKMILQCIDHHLLIYRYRS